MQADEIADILLVEDNANDAELTIIALKQCGARHSVEHVTDGSDALDYINENLFGKHVASIPKLILLDMNLGSMGGLQVLRRLKSDERTRGIPIILLTSSKVAIELAESYKIGVNSYVIKPNDPKEFAKVVAEIGHYWLAVNEPPPL